jgi:hypothetical protein
VLELVQELVYEMVSGKNQVQKLVRGAGTGAEAGNTL